MTPDDYKGKTDGRQGMPYQKFKKTGYAVIEVLHFLKGKPWDAVALGYIHALRPTQLRVVTKGVQIDAQTWRVTVYLMKDNRTISKIEQEVEFGVPEK